MTPVLGGFDSANYKTEREWATASDGTKVPISLVYRQDSVKLGRPPTPSCSTPTALYGYCDDPRPVCVTDCVSMPSMCCLEYFTCWKGITRPS